MSETDYNRKVDCSYFLEPLTHLLDGSCARDGESNGDFSTVANIFPQPLHGEGT